LISDEDYPIYAVDVQENTPISKRSNCLLVGGGKEGSFLGVPLHLYNF
jgi:hypothetical protein